MTTKTCTNGHVMTGIGFDECPECEAPWMTTPTVEEIANKRGYFCVEEIVNEYFSTAPHYRGRRALKILLQEKVGTALETYGNARYEEGAKAEMERCKNLVVAHLRTNTYDGNDARVFKTTIEELVSILDEM